MARIIVVPGISQQFHGIGSFELRRGGRLASQIRGLTEVPEGRKSSSRFIGNAPSAGMRRLENRNALARCFREPVERVGLGAQLVQRALEDLFR